MCSEPSDILMTYNPESVDRYSDSSNFDDELTRKGTTHSILRRKIFRHSTMGTYEKEISSKRYENKHNTEISKDKAIHPRHCACRKCLVPVEEKLYQKRLKLKYYNGEDNSQGIQTTQSKLSMVRSKIMPCLSNIFSRGHSLKRDEATKNKHIIINTTRDNCCQVYCVNCNHKRIKKPTRKKVYNFGMQSSCSTDNDLDNSPDSGINVDSHHKHNISSNISCSFTSSSISENIQAAKKKFKRMLEREIRKSYLRKQLVRNVNEHQFTSRPNFQVFSTPKTSTLSKQELRNMTSFGCNVMPSNSSLFWEYLVDRINKKSQNTNKSDGIVKSCTCTTTQQCPAMDAMLRDATGLPQQLDFKTIATGEKGLLQTNNCPCKSPPINESPNMSQPKVNSPPQKEPKSTASKVHCKCYPTGPSAQTRQESQMPQTLPPSVDSDDMRRPCQEPHDQIKAALEKKYNAEVLCIHNPPCILINGCLNLPPVKGQYSPSAWPVTQRSSFHCGFHKEEVNIQRQEQACQYKPPEDPPDNQPVVEYRTEKMTQSICNHSPPCEVVRCCYKPEYDPKLANSCVHVPMCQKLPECIINENENLMRCDHEPKCAEQPLCKRKPKKYIVLTAKDDISTQVKPNVKMECKHEPPCIMIPKCLGKLMCDGYVPYDAIPDCVHQPSCELIPACCRKSAKMVSVSCQYPSSSCRIV